MDGVSVGIWSNFDEPGYWNGCEIVFKLNAELDVPTLKQMSLSFFLEENSCCFWVAPMAPLFPFVSRVRGKELFDMCCLIFRES